MDVSNLSTWEAKEEWEKERERDAWRRKGVLGKDWDPASSQRGGAEREKEGSWEGRWNPRCRKPFSSLGL